MKQAYTLKYLFHKEEFYSQNTKEMAKASYSGLFSKYSFQVLLTVIHRCTSNKVNMSQLIKPASEIRNENCAVDVGFQCLK